MQIGPNFTAVASRTIAEIATFGDVITWDTWQTSGGAGGTATVHVNESPVSIRHLIGDSSFEEAMAAGGRLVIFVFQPADYITFSTPGQQGTIIYWLDQQWTAKPGKYCVAGGVTQYVVVLGVAGGNR